MCSAVALLVGGAVVAGCGADRDAERGGGPQALVDRLQRALGPVGVVLGEPQLTDSDTALSGVLAITSLSSSTQPCSSKLEKYTRRSEPGASPARIWTSMFTSTLSSSCCVRCCWGSCSIWASVSTGVPLTPIGVTVGTAVPCLAQNADRSAAK